MNENLLQILACPVCKSYLKYSSQKNILKCMDKKCGKEYKIEDEIPIMLI